jgi:hypothetical protein
MNIQNTTLGTGPILAHKPSSDLDCETAALLRAAIRPIFASAVSWNNLAEVLRDKGYRLAFREGRLCVTDRDTGARICGIRFLGFELRELVRRMGRPIVVARGNDADGDILTARPVERA